jgi:Flp pilus assembly protein TadB
VMSDVALGAVLGFGLWLMLDGRPSASLAARIGPHLRDVSTGARRDTRIRELWEVVASLAPHPLRFLRSLWSGRATARARLINSELPALLDRASVCLSAGLSIPSMFERVGRDSIGLLGHEANRISRELSVGVSLADTCTESEKRVRHESWSRMMEHLLSSRRHGTPVAEIMRSLAADERAAAGRRLIEVASSREIYMLLPLVFVILPMAVLVAVFPGLIALGSLHA